MSLHLLGEINLDLKSPEIKLSIMKPNEQTVGRLTEAYDVKESLKLSSTSELNLTIPNVIEQGGQIIKNKNTELMRPRYLVKVKEGNKERIYIIDQPISKSDDSSEDVSYSCLSREYELTFDRIRGYEQESLNCKQALDVCLKDTRWTIGNIPPSLLLKFRGFKVGSKNKYEFLTEIMETFNAIYIPDTVNRKLHIYNKEEFGQYRGLNIKDGHLLEGIEMDVQLSELCTRLICVGGDGLGIQRVNLTGQNYVDDFSYYLYPFERDINKKTIKHSNYMSDALCHAILDHQTLLKSKEGTFNDLLSQLELKQIERTTKQNELFVLETELKKILDTLAIEQESGTDLPEYSPSDRDAKQSQISAKQNEINTINTQISSIESQILQLKTELSYSKNFTEDQLIEMVEFVHRKEFENSNITNDKDLIFEGKKYLGEINTPPVNTKVDIVNFLELVEYQHQWDKLALGDIVRIYHPRLNIDIKTNITAIERDYESGDLSIELNNGKTVLNKYEQIMKEMYGAIFDTKDLKRSKYVWENTALNFNMRNDRISTRPANPVIKSDGTAIDHTINTEGTANISIEWEFNGAGDAYNIDGFVLYAYVSDKPDKYVFGSSIAKEMGQYPLTNEKRNHVFASIPADKYYTFGIQAYRKVDVDVHPDGVLKSDIVQPTASGENPYQPSENVAFGGNITGTINGIPASEFTPYKILSGSYVGDGMSGSKTVNLPWTPKKVEIVGGYEKNGSTSNARFELFTNTSNVFNESGGFTINSNMKCITNGFIYSDNNCTANVNLQTYSWIAYG